MGDQEREGAEFRWEVTPESEEAAPGPPSASNKVTFYITLAIVVSPILALLAARTPAGASFGAMGGISYLVAGIALVVGIAMFLEGKLGKRG
jgi:hypothetical protein